MEQAFIGIDVGTASARAGLFDVQGRLIATARHPIEIWHEPGDIVEQSSTDIWQACVEAVRRVIKDAAVPPEAVGGLGFDATCSLVVLDPSGAPLSVSGSGDPRRNVIVWMDHRAIAEADLISDSGEDVLRFVGGRISPEMETPKLLWLKRHMPATFAQAGHFFDLADFLTFRATGSLTRSLCTLTCKWTYLAHEKRWSERFFDHVGLAGLLADGARRIGHEIVEPGRALARGLTRQAGGELGLREGTPVGASLIDAHAGGIGTVGAAAADGQPASAVDRLAYIMGTSACIMATTEAPCFIPGVWGPYFSAMVPGRWLNEGGQSAAGAAIDHLVLAHPAHAEAAEAARKSGMSLLDFIEHRAIERAGSVGRAATLAARLHVLPEFLGNRSPHADSQARAIVAGLDLDAGLESLENTYVAALCGLAYGLADIVEALRAHGIPSRTMVVSGGLSHSRLVRQIMADATGLGLALPETAEPVLLGAAMLGAVASGATPALAEAMRSMSRLGEVTKASPPEMARFHTAKRKVHALLRRLDGESRSTMAALEIDSAA